MSAAKKVTAVAKLEPNRSSAPAPQQNDQVLSLIDRVMSDPQMPMERVEQAFSLYQRVLDDAERRRSTEAQQEFYRALASMQAEMPTVKKRGKAHNDKAYARWEDIMPEVQPVLSKHGFALTFQPEIIDGNKLRIHARLSHQAGHYVDAAPFILPADTGGNKNAVQALGSSTSYAKRYVACALLNIVAEDEADDDGASATSTITDEQQELLKSIVASMDENPGPFLEYAKVDCFADIKAKDFGRLHAILLKKQKQVKK